MSVKLRLSQKQILHVSRGVFETLYEHIVTISDNEEISTSLQSPIDKLALGCYGIGIDIFNYLDQRQEALSFANIVSKAIEQTMLEYRTIDSLEKNLKNFHSDILEHAETLKSG